MRLLSDLCLVLLLSGLAAAQATIIGGTASTWVPAYGVYAAPFVPLVTTPSFTLSNTTPSPVGASSSAFGLVAGATNSTLSLPSQAGPSVYTAPVWYGPTASEKVVEPAPGRERKHEVRAFDFGVSSEGEGSASWAPSARQIRKAARTYTNLDIDRVNQSTGTVKYGGKTEHI